MTVRRCGETCVSSTVIMSCDNTAGNASSLQDITTTDSVDRNMEGGRRGDVRKWRKIEDCRGESERESEGIYSWERSNKTGVRVETESKIRNKREWETSESEPGQGWDWKKARLLARGYEMPGQGLNSILLLVAVHQLAELWQTQSVSVRVMIKLGDSDGQVTHPVWSLCNVQVKRAATEGKHGKQ